jgi:hypothetical protein
MATLSRRGRPQAVWRSERPSTGPDPASATSGADPDLTGETSSGTAIGELVKPSHDASTRRVMALWYLAGVAQARSRNGSRVERPLMRCRAAGVCHRDHPLGPGGAGERTDRCPRPPDGRHPAQHRPRIRGWPRPAALALRLRADGCASLSLPATRRAERSAGAGDAGAGSGQRVGGTAGDRADAGFDCPALPGPILEAASISLTV